MMAGPRRRVGARRGREDDAAGRARGGLRDVRRLPAAAPDRPRLVHALRPLPRGLPGHGVGPAAVAARPGARPAGPGAGGARAEDRLRHAVVVHAVHGVRRDLPGGHRARADHQPAAARPDREGRPGRRAAERAGGRRDSGNSFGESRRKRARWTRDLDFEVRDARKEPVDVLWFVGDYASLDPRNQRNTLALARLLQAAGVDFGILHDAERTAGNDVRRAGEEGLFRSLAEENIEQISRCEFSAHPDQRPARLQHAAQRVPGRSARRGRPSRWCTTRSCSASCSRPAR